MCYGFTGSLITVFLVSEPTVISIPDSCFSFGATGEATVTVQLQRSQTRPLQRAEASPPGEPLMV